MGETTRRELLEAGAAGLAGLGFIQARPRSEPKRTRLEADRPEAAGMSQVRLNRVVVQAAIESAF